MYILSCVIDNEKPLAQAHTHADSVILLTDPLHLYFTKKSKILILE